MDFRDGRSMKVVFVPHCQLNQNARLAACAELPGAVEELITGLMDRRIGIIQLPCPELMLLGLDREQLDIRSGLSSRPARGALHKMAQELVYQIRQYRECGVRVLGILGKDGSPACGVSTTEDARGPCKGTGVFIESLQAVLKTHNMPVEVVGCVDSEPQVALDVVDRWDQHAA